MQMSGIWLVTSPQKGPPKSGLAARSSQRGGCWVQVQVQVLASLILWLKAQTIQASEARIVGCVCAPEAQGTGPQSLCAFSQKTCLQVTSSSTAGYSAG
jgi:hypothetical protein